VSNKQDSFEFSSSEKTEVNIDNEVSVVTDYVSAFDKDIKKLKEDKEKKGILPSLYEWAETVIFAGCFVLLVFGFIARPARVIGSSMENTLSQDDTVIVSDVLYTPKQGDIIVFQNIAATRSDPLIKRVIATEGQWVNLVFHYDTKSMSVYIAETKEALETADALEETDYAIYLQDAFVQSAIQFPVCVPEGCVFVLGDNRNHSLDSRSMDVGFVDEKNIVGKVLFRAMPLNKFGSPSIK